MFALITQLLRLPKFPNRCLFLNIFFHLDYYVNLLFPPKLSVDGTCVLLLLLLMLVSCLLAVQLIVSFVWCSKYLQLFSESSVDVIGSPLRLIIFISTSTPWSFDATACKHREKAKWKMGLIRSFNLSTFVSVAFDSIFFSLPLQFR